MSASGIIGAWGRGHFIASRYSPGLGAVAGLAAAAVIALGLLLVRVISNSPSLFELVQDGIVLFIPGWLFSAVLDSLGFAAKPLLLAGLVLGLLITGSLLGVLYSRIGPSWRSTLWLIGGLYLVLGIALALVPRAGPFGIDDDSRPPVWIMLPAATVLYGLILHALLRWLGAAASAPVDDSKRSALRAAGAAVGLSVVSLAGWRLLPIVTTAEVSPLSSSAPLPVPTSPTGHPTSEITPVGVFYNVSKNSVDPRVDGASWTISVDGLVRTPYELSLDDLRALPHVEQPATLCCISNEVGGNLIGNGIWRGVRLRDLLERAGVQESATKAVFHCRDDYRDSIDLVHALAPGTLIVYEMNGAQLTDKHGFPARAIVPGIYGMKNAKWIERIELVDFDFRGFWQQLGWSNPAPYQTMSRIDYPLGLSRLEPGTVKVAGIAFAGDRGISRVEVSTDGGTSWQDSDLQPPMGPFTWVLWSLAWMAPQREHREILVRATDGSGTVQTAERAAPFPDGATGLHTTSVTINSA